MPKLSLIVPVYNVEHYLFEALQSIQAQTMTDVQVVLVNDGSTDSSAEIAASFCETDARFVFVDQANSGPGPGGGRNGGLGTATGELIMFMDSDDVIRPSMFADMVALLDGHDNDMVTTSTERLAGVTLRPSTIHDLSHPIEEQSTTAAGSPWLMFDSTPWNKMFRREFFDEHVGTWPAQQLYEDIVPMTTCLLRARGIGVLTTPHYLWRQRSDGSSITQQRRGITGDLAQIEQLRLADRLVREHGDATTKAWLDWKAYTFDFIWMIRKLAILNTQAARELIQAMADAMNEIGTGLLPTLTAPLRSCVQHVLAGNILQARALAARHRLSLVPDRRRYDVAVSVPLLPATLVSSDPHGRGQRIIASSPAAAGPATLQLGAAPPWVTGPAGAAIAPTEVRRRGTRIRSTFDIGVDDVAMVEPGKPCFVELRAGGASGEIQRSLHDRVASRLWRSPEATDVRRVFDGTNVVLYGPAAAPFIDGFEVRDGALVFRGELGPNHAERAIRVTDSGGLFDWTGPIEVEGSRFLTSVPLSPLTADIDYFLAFINSNNPGIPTPLSVSSGTFLWEGQSQRIQLRVSTHRQTYFRCSSNDFRSIGADVRRRFPGRN